MKKILLGYDISIISVCSNILTHKFFRLQGWKHLNTIGSQR